MTRKEATGYLLGLYVVAHDGDDYEHGLNEALDMAIEALEGVCFDEWCDDCKEYDTEKKCCPRFNKVIREAMKRIPHDDGTLEVKVEDATKVGRVLISDDKHRGGLYYPDEDEPQKSYPTEWCEQCNLWEDNKCLGVAHCKRNIEALKHAMSDDLISRADAIRVVEKNSYRMAGLTEVKLKWEIEELPSADKPRGEWVNDEHDIPRCSVCGYIPEFNNHIDDYYYSDFCPNCGADMRGEKQGLEYAENILDSILREQEEDE